MCNQMRLVFLNFKCAMMVILLISNISVFAQQANNHEVSIHLAKPLSENEIAPFNITIFPNGKNLPEGSGGVVEGKALYKNRCALCHGEQGIEGPAARLAGSDGWFSLSDPLRILRIEKYPVLLISVGSLWPHASSILDYIRRAMPHYNPKSLTNNESYALTAYILYLNGIIEDDQWLNKTNITEINMPAQHRR